MSDHLCSICSRGRMQRSERRTFMERVIYPLFGKYPWRCGLCRNRVLLHDRGDRRLYVSQGEGAPGSRSRRSRRPARELPEEPAQALAWQADPEADPGHSRQGDPGEAA